MSSGKLDRTLDEIMKDRKTTTGGATRGKGRLAGRKAATKAKTATAVVVAPTGGVQKNSRAAKATKTRTTLTAVTMTGDSKISVSNLPEDVDEPMIKDYFVKSVGPVKRVILNYGPSGRSRGSATVIFSKPTAAGEAAKLDGVVVDRKPLKIEVLLGANNIPKPAPPKPLSERVAKPKNVAQEKTKGATANGRGANKAAASKGGRKGNSNDTKKSGRAGRPKAKTTEELDAEMQDYFGGGSNATGAVSNGAAQPAAATAAAAVNGDDTGMVDEVM